MTAPLFGPTGEKALEAVLGYLNFSSGAEDTQTLAALNTLVEALEQQDSDGDPPVFLRLGAALKSRLKQLAGASPAFENCEQAQGVLEIVWPHFLTRYREFHSDLLHHQQDEALFRPFFLGRMLEAVLRQGGPWTEQERILEGALEDLNDFVGYRPTAVLENRRIEPYPHEFVRPIPLYIQGAGVSVGPEREVVRRALELLTQTDGYLLQTASFNPELLHELAIDPRAYDFDHPINKRPNYHFGLWDPRCIDNRGYYRRFVVQQVTLDSLLARLDSGDAPADELLMEAGAVLAGTMLMAAAISGSGPEAFDSRVSLSTLLPSIAMLRDNFYAQLLDQMDGEHERRLREEAERLRQPFGGARQHLNAQLARRRASQLEQVHLARLFARMGHFQAAEAEIQKTEVASARLQCQIDCLLTQAERWLESGELELAIEVPAQVAERIENGIEFGAIVDPWNILGFDAHFSLFPALENSVNDHRIDELIAVVDRMFALLSRVWSEAAAGDRQDLCERADQQFQKFAQWWRKYAAHQVESVNSADPDELYHSAKHVARALNLWHKGGAETGNIAFWAPYADLFDAPKGFAMVIDALLHRRDFVTAMALMNHWLSQAERVPLEQGDCSFHEIAEMWLEELRREPPKANEGEPAGPLADDESWQLLHKFFDYLEANAEDYWRTPQFQLNGRGRNAASPDEPHEVEAEDDAENLFDAAYEEMVYVDSTDDGVESELSEFGGSDHHDELSHEAERVTQRLAFLHNLARLWKIVSISEKWRREPNEQQRESRQQSLLHWAQQAMQNHQDLLNLMDAVRQHRIQLVQLDHESMLEYDRQRSVKETLLDRAIVTAVESLDAARLLAAAAHSLHPAAARQTLTGMFEDHETWVPVVRICSAVLRGDRGQIGELMPEVLESLAEQPLLYIPLAKGGLPQEIAAARLRQRVIMDLLVWLPRSGMLVEACQLLDAAREMERNVIVGPGAVTEFDDMFATGYRALVEALIRCEADCEDDECRANSHTEMVELLEKLTESLLLCWLAHSRTLRLSVLEKVGRPTEWKRLVAFIKRYGEDLFSQHFLGLGNIRAILHQGVEQWLQQWEELDPDDDESFQLLRDLAERKIPRRRAIDSLTLVLEAVIENYSEYRDYNSTTTQSDRGEMLYTLLDFLRLRMQYDRVAWNLRPVVWAHDVLVRHGMEEAATTWRKALASRVKKEADSHLRKLRRLQRKYAMRMPTVADRLRERFVKPLEIDSIRALVRPAIEEAKNGGAGDNFRRLRAATKRLTDVPSGVGLDVPPWLMALEEEVDEATRAPLLGLEDVAQFAEFPRARLSLNEIAEQIDRWRSRLPGGMAPEDDDPEEDEPEESP